MIEINLSPTLKTDQNEFQKILSQINVKMLLIAIILSIVPELFYINFTDSEISSLQKQEQGLNNEFQKIAGELSQLRKIEEEVQALKELEANLSDRLIKVGKVFEKKQNPFHILKYLAENIPEDVWIVELAISDGNLVILGFSRSWKSIGKLIDNLKNSIFFEKNIIYEQPKDKLSAYPLWQRMEIFQIKAQIIKYE